MNTKFQWKQTKKKNLSDEVYSSWQMLPSTLYYYRLIKF